MRNILIITTVVILLSAGCSENNKVIQKHSGSNNAIIPAKNDTGNAVIKFDISGGGKGKMTLWYKNGKIRLDLIKAGDTNNTYNESMYIDSGYTYFFLNLKGSFDAYKVPVERGQNFHKSFYVFANASEITPMLKKTGTDEVAGVNCDTYIHTDGSIYSIFAGKYILKAGFNNNIITATEFNQRPVIADTLIEKPKSIEFKLLEKPLNK